MGNRWCTFHGSEFGIWAAYNSNQSIIWKRQMPKFPRQFPGKMEFSIAILRYLRTLQTLQTGNKRHFEEIGIIEAPFVALAIGLAGVTVNCLERCVKSKISAGWCFQPVWKILVKFDHFPKDRGENKNNWNHHPVSVSQHNLGPGRLIGSICFFFNSTIF